MHNFCRGIYGFLVTIVLCWRHTETVPGKQYVNIVYFWKECTLWAALLDGAKWAGLILCSVIQKAAAASAAAATVSKIDQLPLQRQTMRTCA